MAAVIRFLAFWYDFIVGDAWEVAAGVLAALLLAWLLVQVGLLQLAWVVLPVGILLAVGGSLVVAARRG